MKKLFKLAGFWITLFSFAVQTTGAASLGAPMMPVPLAAARLMPAPAKLAAPAPVAPKIVPPAEWGYYVLAAGELTVEGFASARSSARERGENLLRRGLAAGRGLERAWLSAQALLEEPQEAPKGFEPIDLAPSALPAQSDDGSVAAPPFSGPPADRILIAAGSSNEALPVSDVSAPVQVQIPPPTTLFPVSADKPQGEDWWSAAVKAAGRSLPFSVLVTFNPHANPISGAWLTGRGISYRVIYLDPSGTTRADASGLFSTAGSQTERHPDQILPTRYWGLHALYCHGEIANYRIEIRNTGKTALKELDVSAVEEQFMPEGSGRRLPTEEGRGKIAVLEAGRSALLQGSFHIPLQGYLVGNFEQTHVHVIASDGEGGSTLLGDEPRAGLIDPPANK